MLLGLQMLLSLRSTIANYWALTRRLEIEVSHGQAQTKVAFVSRTPPARVGRAQDRALAPLRSLASGEVRLECPAHLEAICGPYIPVNGYALRLDRSPLRVMCSEDRSQVVAIPAP